ncbi:MAG: His-Xaa-Ser system radical SAM maturase HxsB [Clostridiales bacterium]|jgi:His-Xaa-Ser system radical SAM maturase HxsB|nr:His-Xaa-Ser system radical SAM maturase HxsB [Clostridiales bacterium]
MSRLNYFNFKMLDNQVLITNDAGMYAFLEKEEFRKLITERYDNDIELAQKLTHNWFVRDVQEDVFAERIKNDIRNAKNYLFVSTSLFILVVTHRCNSKCVYCQAMASKSAGDMTVKVARKAIDMALNSPSRNITIEFQGGEPLLNYDVIKDAVTYAENECSANKKISFSVVTNLSLLQPEMLSFFIANNVSISTSLDGAEDCHNHNRPMIGKKNGYQILREKISSIFESGYHVGAIQTTTREGLLNPKSTIDAFIEMGLTSVFIRPLTPLGFAAEQWNKIGYAPSEFIEFYEECLKYVLELNRNGVLIQENHAAIWLRKIIGGIQTNYMELRSPCGAAIGQLAVVENGDIYTCDEARMLSQMGDKSFRLGNVFVNSFDDAMNSDVTKAVCVASTLESLPSCCDCVYQPYCGVCPVVNLAMEGNIFAKEAKGYRCKVYEGMLDVIFGILKRNDEIEMEIFRSWL